MREEYLLPLDMMTGALAGKLNLPRTRIERIAKEKSESRLVRLSARQVFQHEAGILDEFKQAYELETEAKKLARELDKIER